MSSGVAAFFALVVVAFALVDSQVAPPPPPPPPQNATAPGLPPTVPLQPSNLTVPAEEEPIAPPVNISILPGGPSTPLPEEPADVPPERPQSACVVTRQIFDKLSASSPNASLPLFTRNAVVKISGSRNDFSVRMRGRRRIGLFMRSHFVFLGQFGPTNFTVSQTPIDQPERCVAIVTFSSPLMENCPGTTDSAISTIVDVHTKNGLVKVMSETVDSTQHQLACECMMQKLSQALGGPGGDD